MNIIPGAGKGKANLSPGVPPCISAGLPAPTGEAASGRGLHAGGSPPHPARDEGGLLALRGCHCVFLWEPPQPDASRLEFWNVLCLGYLGMASYLQYVWAAEEGQTPSGFWERGPMKQNATKHE